MKLKNILIGLFACAALCACTDNDIAGNAGGEVFDGNTLYLVVNIKEVGSTATKATSGGFTNGTENTVKDINFYFYDSDGKLVAQNTPEWADGDAGEDGSDVELTGKRVVVLSGLAKKLIPSYMVTVVNKPSSFTTTPFTLNAMQEALASASDVCGTDYFTMTTSSYYNDDGDDDGYYFATPLSEDDFSTEPIDQDDTGSLTHAVNVYVERLAAKVQLINEIPNKVEGTSIPWHNSGTTDLPDSEGKDITIPGTMERSASTRVSVDVGFFGASIDSTYYTISKTVNTAVQGTTLKFTSETDNIYIHFDAWGLNGTAKQSYLMKHIKSDWNSAGWTGWEDSWNDADNHRSYWGMSYNYGSTGYTYPSSSTDINEETDCLDYLSADDLPNYLDGRVAYCAENTNTVATDGGIIQSKNSPAITNVLVKATMYDNTGYEFEDIVRIGSDLFTTSCYLNYALYAIIKQQGPIYLSSGTQITTPSYFYVNQLSDGYVKVSIQGGSDDKDSTSKYYDANGNEIDAQALIDYYFNDTYGLNAYEYVDGQMYYSIPIEHLNNDYDNGLQEANYGVVRNHYYVVTLKNLTDLGRGIIDPDETIVPQEEDEQVYLGAEVQVLPWKKVSQDVDI